MVYHINLISCWCCVNLSCTILVLVLIALFILHLLLFSFPIILINQAQFQLINETKTVNLEILFDIYNPSVLNVHLNQLELTITLRNTFTEYAFTNVTNITFTTTTLSKGFHTISSVMNLNVGSQQYPTIQKQYEIYFFKTDYYSRLKDFSFALQMNGYISYWFCNFNFVETIQKTQQLKLIQTEKEQIF